MEDIRADLCFPARYSPSEGFPLRHSYGNGQHRPDKSAMQGGGSGWPANVRSEHVHLFIGSAIPASRNVVHAINEDALRPLKQLQGPRSQFNVLL